MFGRRDESRENRGGLSGSLSMEGVLGRESRSPFTGVGGGSGLDRAGGRRSYGAGISRGGDGASEVRPDLGGVRVEETASSQSGPPKRAARP